MVLEDSYFNSKIASTSTATPNGKLLALIAARECLPFSPNTLKIVSDAPFITFGCSIKLSEELT